MRRTRSTSRTIASGVVHTFTGEYLFLLSSPQHVNSTRNINSSVRSICTRAIFEFLCLVARKYYIKTFGYIL